MNSKPIVTADVRTAALAHVRYEWEMLGHMAMQLQLNYASRGSLAVGTWSAWIESFVVHARNLIEFIFGEKSKKDSHAADFLPQGTQLPTMGPAVKKILEMANSQIAHISFKRVWIKPEDREWDIAVVYGEIERGLTDIYRLARTAGAAEFASWLEECGIRPLTVEQPRIDPANDLSVVSPSTSAAGGKPIRTIVSTPGNSPANIQGSTSGPVRD